VATLRARLQQFGFLIRIDAAHEVLRAVLAVEAARLDRHAHDAAAECLRSIQSAAREALELLTQGAPAGVVPLPAQPVPEPPAGAAMAATERPSPGAPRRSPGPRPVPEGEAPVNLAEVVRRRLGEELPPDSRPLRVDTQSQPAPASRSPVSEPRRPVIKHPRKR
jgi:hypothetical protein